MMDHGGIGGAGSEFVENAEDEDIKILQWTWWDPFRQLTRDCKHAIHKDSIAENTQLTSSYVWALNGKPFNSGE